MHVLRALSGWPFDLGAAVVLTLMAVGTAPTPAPARVLAALMCLPVALRSRAPLAALAVAGAAHLAGAALGFHPNGPGFGALLLCLYSVTVDQTTRVSAAAALVIAAGSVFVVWSLGALGVAFGLAAVTATWFIAHDIRTRRELVVALEARSRSAEERAVAEERARIAREVHDVVSHTVGVVAVQAGAARRLFDASPAEAKQALAAVEMTARSALHDLRVLIADDHALVRSGFAMILRADGGVEVMGEAGDGLEAVAAASRLAPDVVLMDARMPRLDGIEATRRILAANPSVRVLVLTIFDQDDYVFEALAAGASGFLLKDIEPEELARAVRIIARGDALLAPSVTRRLVADLVRERPRLSATRRLADLTQRETDVLREVARGLSNREIAARFGVSETTVKTHVAHLLDKLELRDRVQAVIYAFEVGLVTP
jgi:DNA-binding NarL/FixJ family response regulator